MRLHAPNSKPSLSSLIKTIKNLSLTLAHRRLGPDPCAPQQANPPPTHFFDLPPEIRILIYEHYFAASAPRGGTLIAPKSHPRTKFATALLLVSRRVFGEAVGVMYRMGTLTVDLDPRWHVRKKDYAYFLDHVMPPGCNFQGCTAQLLRMRKVHLTLGPRKLQGQSDWWQRIVPIFCTTSRMLLDFTLAIYVGDITTVHPVQSVMGYRRLSFASWVSRPYFRRHGWREKMKQGSESSGAELRARRSGQRFRRLDGVKREVLALATLVGGVGMLGDLLGRELRVEDCGRTRREVVTSDKLPDLVESARRVVGEGEEKGVWLVLGEKKKKKMAMVEGNDEE